MRVQIGVWNRMFLHVSDVQKSLRQKFTVSDQSILIPSWITMDTVSIQGNQE